MNTKSTGFLIIFVTFSFVIALLSLLLPFIDNLAVKYYLKTATDTLPLMNEK